MVLQSMTRSMVLDVLLEEIRKIAPGRAVSPESSITRDLGLDSLAAMNFVMVLEDRFDISIPMDLVAEVETLRDMERVVDHLIEKQYGT